MKAPDLQGRRAKTGPAQSVGDSAILGRERQDVGRHSDPCTEAGCFETFLGLRQQLCSCVVAGVINALSLHSARVEQGLLVPAGVLHLSRPDKSAVYFLIRIFWFRCLFC